MLQSIKKEKLLYLKQSINPSKKKFYTGDLHMCTKNTTFATSKPKKNTKNVLP